MKEYFASARAREIRLGAQHRYRHSEKGRAAAARLAAQPHIIAGRRERRRWCNKTPEQRAVASLRSRLAKVVKGERRDVHLIQLLGCSRAELVAHLERQFWPGMTWENYGKWHVDHVIPCAAAEGAEGMKRVWHYSNLQPLWAADNFLKNARMDWTPSDRRAA